MQHLEYNIWNTTFINEQLRMIEFIGWLANWLPGTLHMLGQLQTSQGEASMPLMHKQNMPSGVGACSSVGIFHTYFQS